MKKVITTENRPIKLWLDDIEEGALDQAKNLANLPFIFKHVAIMPDAHQGYGMPIGGVIATDKVIIPNAVGVDIGCGMCAVKTSISYLDQDGIKKIMNNVRGKIPVGFKHHLKSQNEKLIPEFNEYTPIVKAQYNNALKQIGTLGGGNHFIEIQKGDDNCLWLMVHSGSRNIGYQVAKHYNRLAVDLNEKWFSQIPKKWGLAFLPIDSQEGVLYHTEMQYCIDFALSNRRLMMERVKESVSDICPNVEYDSMINIAHNYAIMENHFGKNVMIHRKGATLARKGTIGIIPGSQGSMSYIVEGLGNKDSFESCSHGAGRRMSRKQAQLTLDLDTEIKQLNTLGIIHTIRSRKNLDEAPGSYKDISIVMDNQIDLVKIIVELKPLAVIKG